MVLSPTRACTQHDGLSKNCLEVDLLCIGASNEGQKLLAERMQNVLYYVHGCRFVLLHPASNDSQIVLKPFSTPPVALVHEQESNSCDLVQSAETAQLSRR